MPRLAGPDVEDAAVVDDGRAAAWAAGFARGWELEDRDQWFAHFEGMSSEDVRLIQPVLPEARGRAALRETFEPVFAMVPDLRAELTSWSGTGDELFVAFTMSGTTAAGTPVSWRAVDRVLLDEQGRTALRESFFDPTPLLRALG